MLSEADSYPKRGMVSALQPALSKNCQLATVVKGSSQLLGSSVFNKSKVQPYSPWQLLSNVLVS